jgi:hypothetical protein
LAQTFVPPLSTPSEGRDDGKASKEYANGYHTLRL